MEQLIIALIAIGFRAFGAYYCSTKATELNREPSGWAIFGFFLPLVAIIWISTKKKNINWHDED
jgi:hypothetical protein